VARLRNSPVAAKAAPHLSSFVVCARASLLLFSRQGFNPRHSHILRIPLLPQDTETRVQPKRERARVPRKARQSASRRGPLSLGPPCSKENSRMARRRRSARLGLGLAAVALAFAGKGRSRSLLSGGERVGRAAGRGGGAGRGRVVLPASTCSQAPPPPPPRRARARGGVSFSAMPPPPLHPSAPSSRRPLGPRPDPAHLDRDVRRLPHHPK
jgi:hypothetical protein